MAYNTICCIIDVAPYLYLEPRARDHMDVWCDKEGNLRRCPTIGDVQGMTYGKLGVLPLFQQG